MKILDILANRIDPINNEDDKLRKLFDFFRYYAPTTESELAIVVDPVRLNSNWERFLENIDDSHYIIISDHCSIEDYLDEYNLNNDAEVNRKSKGFVCKRKGNETDCECVLRHIRNAFAHARVYVNNSGNRKYILFDDYNKRGNQLGKQSARILFSQTDLNKLKQEIIK